MDTRKMIDDVVDWIKKYTDDAGKKGIVIGLSGGIDSSVVAALSKRALPEACLGLIMPCHSNEIDLKYAEKVAEIFDIPVKTVVLDEVYDKLLKSAGEDASEMAKANIKPRLRMTTLYYFAAQRGYLVAGTGNRSEIEVGYYTKFGDGGVDFEPIGHLLKIQVREIAKQLKVPAEVVDRAPTAGLWEHQTDEEEMGITYEQLDNYILTGDAPDYVKKRVNELWQQSEHKRQMPPVPDFFQ